MPGIYVTPENKKSLEIRNGAIQFWWVIDQVQRWETEKLTFRPDVLLELQRLAVNQIYSCAGRLRDGPVYIQGVAHQPPDFSEVPALVSDLCEYVNTNWHARTALHLAAYVMWRINWIHPFFGGNGRTSRAASYLVLCARLGFVIPGAPTIPESIAANREPYYDALKLADSNWSRGVVDVSDMEKLLEKLLASQLVSIHNQATGKGILKG